MLKRTTAGSLHSSFPVEKPLRFLEMKHGPLLKLSAGFSQHTLLPMNMKVRLKKFNHILSFHILSQLNCNQFNVLLMLGLDVAMQTNLTLGVEAM